MLQAARVALEDEERSERLSMSWLDESSSSEASSAMGGNLPLSRPLQPYDYVAGQCPCLSGKAYDECCRPIHLNSSTASSADVLNRARYSAMALAKYGFLVATTDESNPSFREDKRKWRDEIARTVENVQFVGYNEKSTEEVSEDTHAVTFEFAVEKSKMNDMPLVLMQRERVLYRRTNGQWKYLRTDSQVRQIMEGAGSWLRGAVCDVLNSM